MASLSRLPTTLARLSDHLLRPSRPALRSRCIPFTSGAACLNLIANYGCNSLDGASSGASTLALNRLRKNEPKRRGKRMHSSESNPGSSAELGLGISSTTNTVLLSREEALTEYSEGHTYKGDFEADTPLCERPAASVAPLIDLCKWRIQAQQLATLVGSEFVDADGGPEVSDLLRELEWLLDDAVAACASGLDNLSSQSSAWKTCSWREIKALPIAELENDNSLVSSGAREEMREFGADESAIYGAFGALCRDRHTDPVNEFAADCGCSCDGIRETLAEIGSNYELATDSRIQISSVSPLDSISNKLQNDGHTHRNSSWLSKKTGLQILLRMSIEELDKAWKERIQKRRPFQYVVATAHWREYVLGVVEGVLIPRPETEQIVDLVESAISADMSLGQGIWADLGTGSGAIAIAVAHLLEPTGSVLAIDASSAAVHVSTRNIERYSLQSKVKVLQGFWFSPLQDKLGKLAGVVSNPPYIPSDSLIGLQAEVGKHEPRIALDGGPDGMNDLREICRGSATALRQGGFLALETNGAEQAESLCDMLSEMRLLGTCGVPVSCFRDVRTVKDFAGIYRFVTAIRC